MIVGVVVFIAILTSSTAFGGESPEKDNEYVFGAKIGMIGEGTLEAGNVNINTKNSFCLGAFGDKLIVDRLYGGIAVDFFRFKTEADEVFLMNASLLVKGEIGMANDRFLIQPAFGVGYAIMEELLFLKPLDFVTIQFFTDFVYMSPDKIGLLLSVGALWLPHCGLDDYEVTSDARLVARVGARF